MKNRYSLSAVFLSLFLLVVPRGATLAQEQVTSPLSQFERSLTQWMRSMDTLAEKVNNLEKKVEETKGVSPELTRSLQDMASGIGDLRDNISKFSTRLTRIEGLLGGAAVENPMVEFGRTLNTLKQNQAEMQKKVADQAALTAILENRYAEFMRPLDPIKKTLGEYKETLDTLTKEAATQKEKTTAMEALLAERLTILEDFLKASEKQTKTLDVVTKRVVDLEGKAGITPSAELLTEKEVTAVAEQAAAEAAKPKTPEEEGYEAIGDGFYVKGVQFKSFGSSARVVGEIRNLSGQDHRTAIFNIMVYNLNNVLVTDKDFTVKGFNKDTVKVFQEPLTGADPGDISRYVIKFKGVTQF
ncbi:MAG: hypothetical protein AABZ62_09070 [Planctomycetota bacterium]